MSATVDPAFAEAMVQTYVDAWGAHDVDGLLAILHEEVEYDDPAHPVTMHGKDEVRPFLEALFAAVTVEAYELVDDIFLHPREGKISFPWRGVIRFTGKLEPQGLMPTGKRAELVGGDFLEFRDGLIVRLQIFADAASMMQQLGVLPPAGSRAERLGTIMSNFVRRIPGSSSP